LEVESFIAAVGEEWVTGEQWTDYQAAALATPPTRTDHNIPVSFRLYATCTLWLATGITPIK